MENAIDDARVSRGVVGSSSSHANPAYAPIRGTVDESFESVPLKGAGRSLAQRASAHLKALKKSIKKAFTDSGNSSGQASTARRTTYSNDTFVGSPPTGQMLARHHARSRSVDLQHILGNLEETLEGAATAATLLHELRESGGDPDADAATNDALDQELTDVCEAHRAHLTQVAEMSGAGVALSEEQLGTLLSTVENINAALLAIKSETGRHTDAVSAPRAVPEGRPSLGSSRIECAMTEEEEAAMIAQAIALQPALLIADEPTGNLDPETSLGIMDLLLRINRTGTTVLVATHDQTVARAAQRVVHLKDGRVCE